MPTRILYDNTKIAVAKMNGDSFRLKQSRRKRATANRLFVNGVLWVLRSGARWHDLPERYGKYKSVHKRFVRWARAGCGIASSQSW